MIIFHDIATKLGLASNQVEAIRALLCITKDTYIDRRTLKMYEPDLPALLRDWIHLNNPEGIFFAGAFENNFDNDPEIEKLTYGYD